MVNPCVLTIKRKNLWKSRRLTQSRQEVALACYGVRKKRGTFEQWWGEKEEGVRAEGGGVEGRGVKRLHGTFRCHKQKTASRLRTPIIVCKFDGLDVLFFRLSRLPQLGISAKCVCVLGRGDYWLFWVRPSTSRPVYSPLRPWPQ